METNLIFAAFFLACVFAADWLGGLFSCGSRFWERMAFAAAAFVFVAVFLVFAGSLGHPVYLDHTPSMMVLMSMHTNAAMPVYTAFDSGGFFSPSYGPAAFLPASLFMPFFDNPVTAARFSAMVMIFISVILTALVAARNWERSFVFLAVCLALLPVSKIYEPKEAVIHLGFALVLFGAFYLRRGGALMAGLGAAFVLLSKIIAFAGLAVLLPFVFLRRGVRFVLTAFFCFLVLSAAFFLHPSFSFSAWAEYFFLLTEWFETPSSSVSRWDVLRFQSHPHLELYAFWFFVLAFGHMKLRAGMEKSARLAGDFSVFLALLSFASLVYVTVSNYGAAGGFYMGYLQLPWIYWTFESLSFSGKEFSFRDARLSSVRRIGGIALASFLLFVLPFNQISKIGNFFTDIKFAFSRGGVWEQAENVRSEARNFSRLFKGLSAEVGVTDGWNYHYYYWAKPEIYRVSPHTVFVPVNLMGIPDAAENLADSLDEQKTDVFLISRAGEMFSLRNLFPPYSRTFPPRFAGKFRENYLLIGGNAVYGIWAAKSRAGEIGEILLSNRKSP